jgi:hypothetical protein
MDFNDWAKRHPVAAAELVMMTTEMVTHDLPEKAVNKSEAWSQQKVRFDVAKQGAFAFRNNVGATAARCKKCGEKQRPVRYGLANDSTQMNKRIKSHDLILAIPRIITHEMVGTKIAQFGSVECKKPGWEYTGDEREQGQQAWAAFVEHIGGFARFSTGSIDLGLH